MILDDTGAEIYYWPIPNLSEGQMSETIIIRIPTPTGGFLRGTNDPRARIWAKWMMFPSNPFINISTGAGLPLTGMTGPYQRFAIYVEALAALTEAFERVPLTLVAALNQPADWTL